MKLELCGKLDKNRDMYLTAAKSQGYTLSFENGIYYIHILTDPSYVRKAEFKEMEDGTYEFKKEKTDE